MKTLAGLAAAASLLAAASAAQATAVLLDFDAIDTANTTVRTNPIRDFYSGGTARFGDETGPDFGITFTSEVVADCQFGQSCADGNTLINGSPSGPNVLGFNLPSAAFMNVAGGFTGEISLFYAAQLNAVVRVWSGLNGTGDLMGTLTLVRQTGAPCAPPVLLCHFQQASLGFAGVAHSFDFGTASNVAAFDDIALNVNLDTAGAVPEPATWALTILGFGAAGAALRRRRSAASA